MHNELRRLRANRLTIIGSVLTLLIVAMAMLGNYIAPYDPTALNARHRLEAPCADFRFGTDRPRA
jgi:peptide/nickel transport system permease protein